MSLPGSLLPNINRQFFDDDGAPLASGYIRSYIAGTTTNKPLYADADFDAELTNPAQLDAAGRITAFLEPGGYDFLIYNEDMELQATVSGVEDVGLTFLSGLGNIFAEGAKDVNTGYAVLVSDNLVTTDAAETGTPNIDLQPADERTSADAGNGLPLLVLNQSAVDWTITPNGADTINGTLGPYTLPAGGWVQLLSDGVSNYFAFISAGV